MRSTGPTCSISGGSACRAACSRRRSSIMTALSTSSTPASIAAAISSSPRANPGRALVGSGLAARPRGRDRSVAVLRRGRQAWIVNNGAARGHAALRRPSRDLDPALRPARACGRLGPRTMLRRRRRRPVDQSDLDRGAAHHQARRLVLPDLRRRRHRGRPFAGRAAQRPADRALSALSRQPDPDPARPAAGPPLPDHLGRPCRFRRDRRTANGGRPSSRCGPTKATITIPAARPS